MVSFQRPVCRGRIRLSDAPTQQSSLNIPAPSFSTTIYQRTKHRTTIAALRTRRSLSRNQYVATPLVPVHLSDIFHDIIPAAPACAGAVVVVGGRVYADMLPVKGMRAFLFVVVLAGYDRTTMPQADGDVTVAFGASSPYTGWPGCSMLDVPITCQ